MTTRIFTLIVIVLMLAATTFADKKSAKSGGKSGGLKFTEIQSAGSPLVSFRIILRAGAINDPKGKEAARTATTRSTGPR